MLSTVIFLLLFGGTYSLADTGDCPEKSMKVLRSKTFEPDWHNYVLIPGKVDEVIEELDGDDEQACLDACNRNKDCDVCDPSDGRCRMSATFTPTASIEEGSVYKKAELVSKSSSPLQDKDCITDKEREDYAEKYALIDSSTPQILTTPTGNPVFSSTPKIGDGAAEYLSSISTSASAFLFSTLEWITSPSEDATTQSPLPSSDPQSSLVPQSSPDQQSTLDTQSTPDPQTTQDASTVEETETTSSEGPLETQSTTNSPQPTTDLSTHEIDTTTGDGTTASESEPTTEKAETSSTASSRPDWAKGDETDGLLCNQTICICPDRSELKVYTGGSFLTGFGLYKKGQLWAVCGEDSANEYVINSGEITVQCVPSSRQVFAPACPLPIVFFGGYTEKGACAGGARKVVDVKGIPCTSVSADEAVTCTSGGYLCGSLKMDIGVVFCKT